MLRQKSLLGRMRVGKSQSKKDGSDNKLQGPQASEKARRHPDWNKGVQSKERVRFLEDKDLERKEESLRK